MNNTKEILDDLRNITMLTGELASVHEESLRKWPYILFDGIEGVEIKYDLTKQYTKEAGEGYVIYTIDCPKELSHQMSGDDEVHKKCEVLTSWVRDILWKEIKVEIQFPLWGYTNSSKDKDGLSED